MGKHSMVRLGITKEGLAELNLAILKRVGSSEKYTRSKIGEYKILGRKNNIIVVGWRKKDFYRDPSVVKILHRGLEELEIKKIPYIFRANEEDRMLQEMEII